MKEESSPAILAGTSCLHGGSSSAMGPKAVFNDGFEHQPVRPTAGILSTHWPAAS